MADPACITEFLVDGKGTREELDCLVDCPSITAFEVNITGMLSMYARVGLTYSPEWAFTLNGFRTFAISSCSLYPCKWSWGVRPTGLGPM